VPPKDSADDLIPADFGLGQWPPPQGEPFRDLLPGPDEDTGEGPKKKDRPRG